jgi:hypothetical protein
MKPRSLEKMKTAQPKKVQPPTTVWRIVVIIALTLAAVFGAVVLFAMLAKHHGEIPYEQQTYLKIPLVTDAIGKRGKSDKFTEPAPEGYEPLGGFHPLWVKLQAEIGFGGPQDSSTIQEALRLGGGPHKYDLITKGKVVVKQAPGVQILASDDAVWRETRQWCVKLKPGSSSPSLGEMIWRLSSVKGASEIGLTPRKIYFKDLPSALAEQIEARYPDGFFLPVQANSYGNKKNNVTNTFWTLATDTKICPQFTVLALPDQLDQALKQFEAESQTAWLSTQDKDDMMRKANERVEKDFQQTREANTNEAASVGNSLVMSNQQIKEDTAVADRATESATLSVYVRPVIEATTGIKLAVTQHFKEKGKWPTNNFNLGIFSPDAYRNSGHLSAPRIISIVVEPDENTARIHVQYLSENDEVRRLFFYAPANGEIKSWACISPDIRNIAAYVPACKYSAM